jgi:hypothetical protein
MSTTTTKIRKSWCYVYKIGSSRIDLVETTGTRAEREALRIAKERRLPPEAVKFLSVEAI